MRHAVLILGTLLLASCTNGETNSAAAELPASLSQSAQVNVKLNLNESTEATPAAGLQALKTAVAELQATRIIVPIGQFEPVVVGDEPRDPTSATQPGVRGVPMERFQSAPLQDLIASRPDLAAMIYVDHIANRDYLVLMNKELIDRVSSEMSALGQDRPSDDDLEPVAVETSPWKEKSLSGYADNRTRFGIADGWPANHTTLMKVGYRAGCTGGAIDPRLVLTAAHCIFNGDGDYVASSSFQPRRDGGTLPYGTKTISGSWYPAAFVNANCNTNWNVSDCAKHDWAVSLTTTDVPAWFGLAYAGDSTVEGWSMRNVGYPSCSVNEPDRPANCVNLTAYGDISGCNNSTIVTDYTTAWPHNGDEGVVWAGCDISPGHSGGPIYTYSVEPGGGPYLVAVANSGQCGGTNCARSAKATRLTQGLFDYLMVLKAEN